MFTEDVLDEDKGECVICLEEMEQGDTIARLPCLCIYHKGYVLGNVMYRNNSNIIDCCTCVTG